MPSSLSRVLLACAASALAACSCGASHTIADGGFDAGADAASPPDAHATDAPAGDAAATDAASDAARDASTGCVTHRLALMRIEALRSMESQPIHASRSFRVQATYTQPDGCHGRAMPRVLVDSSARTVDVTIRDWVSEGTGCVELERMDTRTLTLGPLGAGAWTIRDASPGGTATLSLTVGPPVPAPCLPDGGDCVQDCDCLEGDVCLSTVGLGGPFQACVSPCEQDADCAARGGRCISVDDGFELTCDRTSAACDPARPCPRGYGCDAGVCRASFRLSASTRVECLCDAECEPGL
ncbi:MAG: hypothetical protein IT378_08070, partial [Sandaracinaceae bacterium]|nr:hypothetical protein [Sandaracinaceae bacterium]